MWKLAPFAASLLIVAAGCGDSGTRTITETTTVTQTSTSETVDEGGGSSSGDCTGAKLETQSATGSSAVALPQPVRDARDAIVAAAQSCDYDALTELTDHDAFAYEGGAGAGGGFGRYLQQQDTSRHLTARLVQLLGTPATKLQADGTTIYAWPSAHGEHPTDADWDALAKSGAYSAREVAAFRRDGTYYGYRIGILPDGTWSYFSVGG